MRGRKQRSRRLVMRPRQCTDPDLIPRHSTPVHVRRSDLGSPRPPDLKLASIQPVASPMASSKVSRARALPAIHSMIKLRPCSLSPPGYPGDHPCPAKGAAIQSHNDEDQRTLQHGTLGVRQERYSEDELH